MSQDDWSMPGRALSDTVTVYDIDAAMAHSQVSKEASEFDKCAGRFSKLCNIHANTVTLVQRIVYRGDAPQLVRYEETKRALGQHCGELWVFHGTGSEQNFTAIMAGGMAAGGAPGVPVLNGAAHGQGVYTAIGAATPMEYSAKGGLAKVLLLKGVPGQIGVNHLRPVADWIVFNRGANPALLGADQLLPWCVITFGRANAHAALAMPPMPVRMPALVRRNAAAVAAQQHAAAVAAAAAAAAAKAAAVAAADAARDKQERDEFQQALDASLKVGDAAKARAADEDKELAKAIEASLGEVLLARPRAGGGGRAGKDTDSEVEDAGIEYSPLELAIMESERTFRLEEKSRSSGKRGSNVVIDNDDDNDENDKYFSADKDDDEDDDEVRENRPMWRQQQQPSRKKKRMRPHRAEQGHFVDLSDGDGVIVID